MARIKPKKPGPNHPWRKWRPGGLAPEGKERERAAYDEPAEHSRRPTAERRRDCGNGPPVRAEVWPVCGCDRLLEKIDGARISHRMGRPEALPGGVFAEAERTPAPDWNSPRGGDGKGRAGADAERGRTSQRRKWSEQSSGQSGSAGDCRAPDRARASGRDFVQRKRRESAEVHERTELRSACEPRGNRECSGKDAEQRGVRGAAQLESAGSCDRKPASSERQDREPIPRQVRPRGAGAGDTGGVW